MKIYVVEFKVLSNIAHFSRRVADLTLAENEDDAVRIGLWLTCRYNGEIPENFEAITTEALRTAEREYAGAAREECPFYFRFEKVVELERVGGMKVNYKLEEKASKEIAEVETSKKYIRFEK